MPGHGSLIRLFTSFAVGLALIIAGPAYGEIKIMPLGDSITKGSGSSDSTGYRRALYLSLIGAGYDVNFVGSLNGGIPTDFDQDHEGHSGWHADEIRDNVYTWLGTNPADIVLLHIGTNDISGGDEDVNEVEAILDNIDQYEADNGTHIAVFLARIILRGDTKNAQTIAFNDAVDAMVAARVVAGDAIVIVDMETALTYPDDLADSVHPNDTGYSKMANAWLVAVDDFLSVPPEDPPPPTGGGTVSGGGGGGG